MSLYFWGKIGVSARPGYSVVRGQPRQWWPIAFQNIIQTFSWKCTRLWLLNIILYLRSTLFSLEWKLMLTETFVLLFAIYILLIALCDCHSVLSPWMLFLCFQQGTRCNSTIPSHILPFFFFFLHSFNPVASHLLGLNLLISFARLTNTSHKPKPN